MENGRPTSAFRFRFRLRNCESFHKEYWAYSIIPELKHSCRNRMFGGRGHVSHIRAFSFFFLFWKIIFSKPPVPHRSASDPHTNSGIFGPAEDLIQSGNCWCFWHWQWGLNWVLTKTNDTESSVITKREVHFKKKNNNVFCYWVYIGYSFHSGLIELFLVPASSPRLV